MKVYINGRFLSQRVTGVQRYAREIVEEIDRILKKEDNQDEWCILVPSNVVNELSLSFIKVHKCGKLRGHFWEQLELPIYSRDGFLINLCNCAPLLKKRQLVTIHDAAVMAYPSAYSWLFRTWYKIMFFVCGRFAAKITTVSNFSKAELNDYFDIPLDKIVVIYNGIDHMDKIKPDESIIEELRLSEKKFVLAVSSQNPTKNFSLVLKSAKLLQEVKFVIVGGSNQAVFAKKNIDKTKNVVYTGYLSDEKLISLYRHATVFVYPSLYEGFGIPPLEAMSQGCPAIVSTCASLPEICGDWAVYCQKDDENELADKIKKIMNNDSNTNSLSRDVKEKYSWPKSAELLLDFIRR